MLSTAPAVFLSPVLQDIGDKYPEWLEANKDKLSAG